MKKCKSERIKVGNPEQQNGENMRVTIHQDHFELVDFQSIEKALLETMKKRIDGLHVYPELSLCGYPLQDLVLQRGFITAYQRYLTSLHEKMARLPLHEEAIYLLGGLHYVWKELKTPEKILNGVFQAIPGKGMKFLYAKKLLPNYDIFDEKKYYTEGEQTCILKFQNKKIGVTVCEDMWATENHPHDPIKDLEDKELDLVVNLSASPYHLGKLELRLKQAQLHSQNLGCPFVYCNRVGAEDEIIFDGRSFVVDGKDVKLMGEEFKACEMTFDLEKLQSQKSLVLENLGAQASHRWGPLYTPTLEDTEKGPPILKTWGHSECEQIINALCFGLRDYAQKNRFQKFLVANSGGIDSALSLALCVLATGDPSKVEAVFMPARYTSSLSFDLAKDLCDKLGVRQYHAPIKFLHATGRRFFEENFKAPLEGLADENIQSRLRGLVIYARSNQTGAMVINTSNKSELAVGYSTQYGDSVGALSLLGDLYKGEVYQLAEHINQTRGELIPDGILTRGPSAELREDQLDAQGLPPYERLDAILEGYLSFCLDKEELISSGHDPKYVEKTLDLYNRSEYKRFQFCPILKVKSKSFGTGYRIPISKHSY